MKQIYSFALLFFIIVNSTFAQVNSSPGTWNPIGNVILSTVTDDADNGDGIGDGAVYVAGQSAVVGQGAAYTFAGTMQTGQAISVSTYTYNRNNSFVKFTVDLYNKTENKVLQTSPTITLLANDITPKNTILTYTAVASDNGDELQVRYIRVDDGATARRFAIDVITLNNSITSSGPCPFTITPDLQLTASTPAIDAQINAAVTKFSDGFLGTVAPTTAAMTSAENAYDALNITVTGGTISGNPITSFGNLAFLKTFAQHLKFNPGDTNIKTKANNTVWWVAKQFCDGSLAVDNQLYSYQVYARPASLLKDFLTPQVKNLFAYTLYQHSVQFEHFWSPTYDSAYQQVNGVINTDVVYNIGDVLLAYSLWQETADESYRYMRAYKRFMDRFFSYTVGTNDGIKPDGTGYHHWTAYNNYMYSFNTAAEIVSYLTGSAFQVEQSSYKVFRDSFFTQFVQSNDHFFRGGPTGTQRSGTQPLSTAGRNPQTRSNPLSEASLKTLAKAGGSILGLTTADPVLAGVSNRIFGIDPQLNSNVVTPFEGGFFQFNHAMAGLYRYENTKTLVFNRGFSNNMWGAEAYIDQNRYGRYQSYGALEVIYPGDRTTGNGYDLTIGTSSSAWDWNFNPGTTVIRLPWDKLHAEFSRLDELQQKRFVGSLALKNKNKELLSKIQGTFGMFAMDFQESDTQGFGTNYTGGTKNHNKTFTFKKSNFFFDDIIVCLGSGITNTGAGTNETVTTLFQRMDNKGTGVNVNGTIQSSGTNSYPSVSANNYLVDNYGTGFYLVSGNDNIVVKKEAQQTPNQNQTWSSGLTLSAPTNPIVNYYTGYINHGANPTNKGYEYVLKPNSSASEMQALDMAIQSTNKPYAVRQKNATAHIVEHIAKKMWGYAFFAAASNLTYDFVNAANGSCLLMTQFDSSNGSLLLAIDNPDLGFNSQANSPSIQVTRQITLLGEWALSTTYPGVQVLSSNSTTTVIEFTLVDGLAKEVLLTNAVLANPDFEKSAVTIYPNPAKDKVSINGFDATTIKKASIISILGQNIKSIDNPGNQIDISNIQDGIYLLKLQLEDNKVITKKLVIKK